LPRICAVDFSVSAAAVLFLLPSAHDPLQNSEIAPNRQERLCCGLGHARPRAKFGVLERQTDTRAPGSLRKSVLIKEFKGRVRSVALILWETRGRREVFGFENGRREIKRNSLSQTPGKPRQEMLFPATLGALLVNQEKGRASALPRIP
jgi:hypothetical protein